VYDEDCHCEQNLTERAAGSDSRARAQRPAAQAGYTTSIAFRTKCVDGITVNEKVLEHHLETTIGSRRRNSRPCQGQKVQVMASVVPKSFFAAPTACGLLS
jgi:hypothetical protein